MLGGIEKLEGGWVVAVIQYKGYRVIIPMEEMMINLEGDGRENADTINRQTRSLILLCGTWIRRHAALLHPEKKPCSENGSFFILPKARTDIRWCVPAGLWKPE